jgi:hypothetical protein
MTLMRIVLECEDTPRNRQLADRLFDNVRGRIANPDYADGLPVTRSLDHPDEMSKVIDTIPVTGMHIADTSANPTDAPTIADLTTAVTKTMNRLTECANLPHDWDSYGASTPTTVAINTARQVLAAIRATAAIDPGMRHLNTTPTPPGGIQFEWHVNGWSVEIEIDPAGRIDTWAYDHNGNTFAYPPDDTPTPPGRVPVGPWMRMGCGCLVKESRPDGFTIDPQQPRVCGRHLSGHPASLYPSPQGMAMVPVSYHDTEDDAKAAPLPRADEDAVGFAAELTADARIRAHLAAYGYTPGLFVVVGRHTPADWAHFRVWRDPAAPGGWAGKLTGKQP